MRALVFHSVVFFPGSLGRGIQLQLVNEGKGEDIQFTEENRVSFGDASLQQLQRERFALRAPSGVVAGSRFFLV